MTRSIALAFLLLCAACRPGPDDAPPMQVDVIGTRLAQDLVAESLAAGLTGRDPAGRVVPDIAQSWRVATDGLSIVFRLREAEFADGRPVTAADVVASLSAARNGRRGAEWRDLLAGVTAVSAPLDSVVEIRLSTPQPELLELLAAPALAIRPRARPDSAAGPFILVDGEGGAGTASTWQLVRNPRSWMRDSIALGAIELRATNSDDALARFNRGQSDLVLGGGLETLGAARVTTRRDTLRLETRRTALTLLLNHSNEHLARLEVRRALQIAIDRVALGPALYATPAASPVLGLTPPALELHRPPAPDWEGLPMATRQEEARRLLLEAGIDPLVGPLRLQVAISDSPSDARIMEAIAADLAAIGVELVLARRSADAHAAAVAGGDFTIALVRREAPFDSPLPFLLPMRCGANRHGVCLPEADRLLAESWRAPDLATRSQLLAAAERLWMDDAAAIGLLQPVGWSLVSPRVGGFEPNRTGRHSLHALTYTPPIRSRP